MLLGSSCPADHGKGHYNNDEDDDDDDDDDDYDDDDDDDERTLIYCGSRNQCLT